LNQPMWKPNSLGTEIASRRLRFRPRRGGRREVVVRIGQPVRSPRPKRGDPWWCPFEIVGLGSLQLSAAAGQDSVQAVILALRGIEGALQSSAKRAGGTIDWLGDTERPVFAHTFFTSVYESAIANLVDGLRLACELIERPGGSRAYEIQSDRLRKLTEAWGFAKGHALRRSHRGKSAG
jgi:hypothetical protein